MTDNLKEELTDNLEEELRIDFHRLHINWRDHSTNFMKWGQKWVTAVGKRDRIKEASSILKADLTKKYREEVLAENKKPPTVAEVESEIFTNEEYKQKQQELINAEEDVNTYATAKLDFSHRKSAIEGIAKLWHDGYWSTPNIPMEVKEVFEKIRDEYQKNQQETLSKNPRLKKRKPIRKAK